MFANLICSDVSHDLIHQAQSKARRGRFPPCLRLPRVSDDFRSFASHPFPASPAIPHSKTVEPGFPRLVALRGLFFMHNLHPWYITGPAYRSSPSATEKHRFAVWRLLALCEGKSSISSASSFLQKNLPTKKLIFNDIHIESWRDTTCFKSNMANSWASYQIHFALQGWATNIYQTIPKCTQFIHRCVFPAHQIHFRNAARRRFVAFIKHLITSVAGPRTSLCTTG